MTDRPTVALIHATPASMAPAHAAFAELFPKARLWNLLDDLLISEAEAAGGLTPQLRHRMRTLIRHAVDGGADAILLSCSMYGPVASAVAAEYPQPVLPSDHALFDEVGRSRARRVTVLGPIATGVADTVARMRERLGAVHPDPPTVRGIVVDGAREASVAGDFGTLGELMARSAQEVAPTTDLIVLGQFSLAPALASAQAAVPIPVLSPPHLAARVLQGHFTRTTP